MNAREEIKLEIKCCRQQNLAFILYFVGFSLNDYDFFELIHQGISFMKIV